MLMTLVQSKGYDEELEVAMVSPKGGLLDIIGIHTNLMVAGCEVEFG